ncbi:MAG: hypothetical protein PHW95_04520 [Patescibacteria group bacterium]|nr:hypothetical protein [Patescibacteria group bacterium]
MIISALVTTLGIILIGIIQVSFLTTWPAPVSSLNIILTLVIFLAVIVNYNKSLIWAFGGALFLELYSGQQFGVTSISLVLTVIIINFLFSNVFTNRSYYSLMILGYLGTMIYNLLIIITGLLIFQAAIKDMITSSGLIFLFVWQPIFNLIILTVVFFTYYLSTGRLKNFFLFRD